MEERTKMAEKIYITNNYEQFKFIPGNRKISQKHVNEIKKSILKYGYFEDKPIHVNSDMEIQDGQHRFVACKELGEPIRYVIEEKKSLERITTENSICKKWETIDFINAKAIDGNESYIRLEKLMDQFSPKYTLAIICCIAKNRVYISPTAFGVIDGTFTCTQDEYLMAEKVFRFIDDIHGDFKKIRGYRSIVIEAIAWIYRNCEDISEDKLKSAAIRVINRSHYEGLEIATVYGGLRALEDAYNYRTRGKAISFTTLYKNKTRGK